MNINQELVNDIYLYSGIFATIVLLAKTFIPTDFGSEITGDFNGITETDSSFNLLSLESILSFFMCFGWMGYYSIHFLHNTTKLSLIIAISCGVVGMLFFAFLFSLIKKMEFVPKNDLRELINKKGKSYTKFKPNGIGQIQIEFSEKLATLDAINNSNIEINSFEMIKVVKVENNIVYIEKA